jgi:hypothetical protein
MSGSNVSTGMDDVVNWPVKGDRPMTELMLLMPD